MMSFTESKFTVETVTRRMNVVSTKEHLVGYFFIYLYLLYMFLTFIFVMFVNISSKEHLMG